MVYSYNCLTQFINSSEFTDLLLLDFHLQILLDKCRSDFLCDFFNKKLKFVLHIVLSFTFSFIYRMFICSSLRRFSTLSLLFLRFIPSFLIGASSDIIKTVSIKFFTALSSTQFSALSIILTITKKFINKTSYQQSSKAFWIGQRMFSIQHVF